MTRPARLTAATLTPALLAIALLAPPPVAAAGDPAIAKEAVAGARSQGVPGKTCRSGFKRQGAWLCMTGTRGRDTFANAAYDCMNLGARVADYVDWRYRYYKGDGKTPAVGL